MRILTGKTLAYFAQHQSEHLTLIRAHLLDLIDARPPLAQAKNMRSAWSALDKQAPVFNEAFQAALQKSIDDEVRLVLSEAPGAGFSQESLIEALDNQDPDTNSLALIDVSEMERILLVDRVAQRFAAHYGAGVNLLTLRLGVLLGLEAPTAASNPFRPEVFVRAFLLAWDKSALDDQAAEDLILALDPQHSLDLAPLYADLNDALEQAGIEAQTVHRIRKSEGGAGSSRWGPISAGAPLSGSEPPSANPNSGFGALEPERADSGWGALAPAGRSIAAHARQFLNKLGWGGPAATQADAAVGEAVHAAADPEFMGYLGQMQAGADAAASPPVQDGQDPRSYNVLRQMLDQEEVRRAPELDRGTVDVLAEVFDFVFSDPTIPLQMKYVIGRLQIPVLKAAMIDREFFLSADHPARQLVDTLAMASISWSPEKGEDDPLYQRVNNTVQRVLAEFEDDLELFSELLGEFIQFLFAVEQQVQDNIEPAVDQERVGESLEQAQAHADEVVRARLNAVPAESPLVPFLVPFLTTQWREVMAQAWLAVQTSPQSWADTLTCMDQLIWSTQPRTEAGDGRELMAVLPELVRNLNAGLDDIGWTGEARDTFTRRLIDTHMAAVRVKPPAPADTASAVLEEHTGKAAMQELDQRLAAQQSGDGDEFDAMARSFTRGLWFDFTLNQSTKHRCRLSWISPLRTRFLFTNRDGFDAFVRSEHEVAKLLRRGKLSVIDPLPIVSRALDQIMSGDEPTEK